MAIHDFDRRMSEADKPDVRLRVDELLRAEFGAVRVERAEVEDDRRGVDFWAYLRSGRRQGVDLKARRRDWGDLYVELISRKGDEAPGWTVDHHKITDYVLFLWPDRHLLLPYPQLRATVLRNEATYRETYGTRWAKSRSSTGEWSTENCPIPEGVLFRDLFGISLTGLALTAPRECPSCHGMHAVGTRCAAA